MPEIRKIRVIVFWLLMIITTTNIPALGQLQVWRHINTSGMSYSNVTSITDDTSGLIYFGTQEGVEVFDGRNFEQIIVPNRVQKGINPYVNNIKWDKAGLLWVGTRSHIYNYSPATGRICIPNFSALRTNISLMELDASVNRLYISRANNFFAYTIKDTSLVQLFHFEMANSINKLVPGNNGDLFAIQNNSRLIQIIDTSIKQIFTTSLIKDMGYISQSNGLVLLAEDGLSYFDIKNNVFTHLNIKRDWQLKSAITHISVLDNGSIMIHLPDGLYMLKSIKDTFLTRFEHDEKNEWSIKTNLITKTFADRKSNLWVFEQGTGLSVLPTVSDSIHFLPGSSIGGSRLWRMYHDSANSRIFTSSESGLCALQYQNNLIKFQPNIKPKDQPIFEVLEFVKWTENTLLLTTNGQGTWFFNTHTYEFKPFTAFNKLGLPRNVMSAFRINDDSLLFYGPGGLYSFDRKNIILTDIKRYDSIDGHLANALFRFPVYGMCRDDKQQYWFGTGTGIAKTYPNMKLIKNYGGKSPGNNDGLGNNIILDIKQINGSIYVATMGAGVYILTAKDTFMQVPLVGNLAIVYCIEAIDNNHILFTTSKGMCLYNTQNGASQLLNASNGMPIVDFNQYALYHDKQVLLGAGSKGLVLIGAKNIPNQFHDTARLLCMTGSLITREITLQKGQHALDANITITGYSASLDWKIDYKLEGVDEDWRTMSKGEWHIHYNSVPPGEYILRVRAKDAMGVVWVKPLEILVNAIPHFWETFWFRTILVFCGLALLILIVRFFSHQSLKWRLKKLEDEQKISRERLRISRELHDNVGSQLTYLITGLESSGILLQKKDTGLLKDKIENMQQSARESMQQLRDAIWALNSESVATSVLLSRFEKWLNKIMDAFPTIKTTLNSRIDHDIILDPLKSLNLFRIMQEAVHNVIKHSGASELIITFIAEPNHIKISIKDNGKGFDQSVSKGQGTRTMVARAQEMEAVINLISAENTGTEVLVELFYK